jgi:ribosomal protein S8
MTKAPILAVPETALLRSENGNWIVYSKVEHKISGKKHGYISKSEIIEETHQHAEQELEQISFIAQEVTLGETYRLYSQEQQKWLSYREISGVAQNSSIAITGAFFIASQGAKSGFDAHNH